MKEGRKTVVVVQYLVVTAVTIISDDSTLNLHLGWLRVISTCAALITANTVVIIIISKVLLLMSMKHCMSTFLVSELSLTQQQQCQFGRLCN